MGWGEREGGRKKGGIMFQHELLFPESKLDRIIESKLNRMSILRFRFFFFFFLFFREYNLEDRRTIRCMLISSRQLQWLLLPMDAINRTIVVSKSFVIATLPYGNLTAISSFRNIYRLFMFNDLLVRLLEGP